MSAETYRLLIKR